MPTLMDHVIEGKLQDGDKIDFSKERFAVRAFVNDQEVANANVDSSGNYKLTFKSEAERPNTKLLVAPAVAPEGATPMPAAAETLTPAQFSVSNNLSTAHRDVQISSAALDAARLFAARYHMFGQVFAQSTYTIEPVPALKMDFYEFSWGPLLLQPFFPIRQPSMPSGRFFPFPDVIPRFPIKEETYLGSAYTDPEGRYDFRFFFGRLLTPPWLRPDPQPDILVKISQFSGGIWSEVYRGPVDWNIATNFHRDFLVPACNLRPAPGVRPTTGFALTSLGLIPCDAAHLVKGYATTDSEDPQPIANMTHRPFAETLRIFGLFAAVPPVATYKVEIAPTDENHLPGVGPALAWQTVTDQLFNLKWNATNKLWEHRLLGPDPVTNAYTNIDTEPEGNWFEHGLKFTFNSAQKPDGFYAFRITGFDAANNQVGQPVELPVLRVDNTVPTAILEAPDAGVCGGQTLPTERTLRLKVTAYDPAGHVLNFSLRATRGKQPDPYDPVLTSISPSIYMPAPGSGVLDKEEMVMIGNLPAALAGCANLAYNFELAVYGSATNGYSSVLSSQYVRKDINLIVSEP
ncbi:MAG: hypothetical protein LAP21_01810 [Acidobacteriia bacterium]|nr:hypothetical protein [Terriglobia bacterium]